MSTKSTNTADGRIRRKAANKATARLRCPLDKDDAGYLGYISAIRVAQRWRSQHILPTESCFQQLLAVAQGFPHAVLSFRLKRMKSILAKIRRPGKDYQLGTLDDIGGCRLILNDIDQVNQAVPALQGQLELKHGNGVKNYIERPRLSGYRSCHLITVNEDAGRKYRVEVQVRTRLQHLWSTAVEAASLARGTDLKAERKVEETGAWEREVREFFAIVSSLFALEEGTAQVEGYVGAKDELVERLRGLGCLDELLNDLSIIDNGVRVEWNAPQIESPGLYLLSLSPELQFLRIVSYGDEIGAAIEAYNRSESGVVSEPMQEEYGGFSDVVLAYAENRSHLDLAFPNYFAKVGDFLDRVRGCLQT